MKINFIYKKKISFSKVEKDLIKTVVSFISQKENCSLGDVNIVFCSDKFIQKHNREFLNHDFETDIITFYDLVSKNDFNNGSDNDNDNDNGNGKKSDRPDEYIINGDLLISADTVLSNSVRFKTEFKDEISRVIIHGILHLCGYKDKTATQKKSMKSKENYYLKSLKKTDAGKNN